MPQAGEYIVFGMAVQASWVNGSNGDLGLYIRKNTTHVSRMTANTANWHFGHNMEVVSCVAGDKLSVVAENFSSIPMYLNVKMVVIPIFTP